MGRGRARPAQLETHKMPTQNNISLRFLWKSLFRPIVALGAVSWVVSSAPAQATANGSPDPNQTVMDRLHSVTTRAEPEWRVHTDIAHPEDPNLEDTGWETMQVEGKWPIGARVLRRWIEVPEKIDGYAIRGSRLQLDLYLTSPGRVLLTVFANGAMVFHGDDDQQQLIPLTENAQPGQRFLIAVRADAEEKETEIYRSRLIIQPPATRPDPEFVREEILAAVR
jgi:hypothetical protein